MNKTNLEIETQVCRLCGGAPRWRDALVNGAHPVCQALKPLEELLDATDDPSIEDETDRYSNTVHAVLTLWQRLPRGEQEKTLRFLEHELAGTNRMCAAVDLSDEDADKDNQARALAAMRENGLEIVVHCVFGEDDGMPRTLCLDVYGDSDKRRDDFFWWLTNLLEPFGGEVQEVNYAADTRVKCALCKREGPPELMKTFTRGYVHHLCDARERAAWGAEDA